MVLCGLDTLVGNRCILCVLVDPVSIALFVSLMECMLTHQFISIFPYSICWPCPWCYLSLELQMMIYGAIFGCLSPILSISAFLSYKSPFVYPKDEVHFNFWINFVSLSEQKRYVAELFCCVNLQRQNVDRAKLALVTDKIDGASESDEGSKQSDHLLMMVAYKKWEKILRKVSLWTPMDRFTYTRL